MANSLYTNPIIMESAAAAWTGLKYVREVQWVDDNADIADNDELQITVNGATINIKVQKPSDVGHQDPIVWRLGPFSPGIPMTDFTVDTIDHGDLLIFIE